MNDILKEEIEMPRRLGSRQQEALRQVTANAPNLRSTIDRARQNSEATGNSVVRELNNLAARGNSQAATALRFMRQGGASTGGQGG